MLRNLMLIFWKLERMLDLKVELLQGSFLFQLHKNCMFLHSLAYTIVQSWFYLGCHF
ncbi:unnamed protein product [Prunus brigantina]